MASIVRCHNGHIDTDSSLEDTSMNIDFVIMGHKSRKQYFPYFRERLDRYVKFSIDDGTLGQWPNAHRAWLMVDRKSDYGIIIQDDAILCDQFKLKVKDFLTEHNGQVCSFYYGKHNKNKYVRPSYFDAPLYHAVALAIPTPQIAHMVAYCDKRDEVFGDDMKIKRWLISQNKTCRYSNPSLVQHRDIPSIINPEKPIRQSTIYKQGETNG